MANLGFNIIHIIEFLNEHFENLETLKYNENKLKKYMEMKKNERKRPIKKGGV